jgi:cytochrome P450
MQARGRVMEMLEKIIRERRNEINSHNNHHEDFLQQLLAVDNDTPQLTDAEIKDNILTMIIAGQDTTASALTWMVKYLGENQKVLDILIVSSIISFSCGMHFNIYLSLKFVLKKILIILIAAFQFQ